MSNIRLAPGSVNYESNQTGQDVPWYGQDRSGPGKDVDGLDLAMLARIRAEFAAEDAARAAGLPA